MKKFPDKKNKRRKTRIRPYRLAAAVLALVLTLSAVPDLPAAAEDPALSQEQSVGEESGQTEAAAAGEGQTEVSQEEQPEAGNQKNTGTDGTEDAGDSGAPAEDKNGQESAPANESQELQKESGTYSEEKESSPAGDNSQSASNGETQTEAQTETQSEETEETEETQEQDPLTFTSTGIHYLQMADGSLLVLADDGRIEYNIPSATAEKYIKDGELDTEGLKTAMESQTSSAPAKAKARVMTLAEDTPQPYAEIPQQDAWIDAARYFDFHCSSSEEEDLNDEVQQKLIEDYGRETAEVPAGLLRDVLPEMVVANGFDHTYLTATVGGKETEEDKWTGGVTIHQVGILRIDNVDYVYYTTDHEADPDTLYTVLKINSSTTEADLANQTGDKIRVEYEHVNGHPLEYIVREPNGDGTFNLNPELPDGWTKDKIFGEDSRPLAMKGESDEQPSAVIPVSIPRGYTAEVTADFISKEGGAAQPVPIRFQTGEEGDNVDTTKYDSLSLGVEWKYDENGNIDKPEAGSETDALSEFVYVECTHEDHDDLTDMGNVTITVTLTKNDTPQFSAEWWLKSGDVKDKNGKKMFSFHGLTEQSRENAEWSDGVYLGQGGRADVAADDKKIQVNSTVSAQGASPGPYSFKWQINSLAGASDMGGYNGTFNTLLDKLEINGQKINVPRIPENSVSLGEAGRNELIAEDEATTVLNSGTVIHLKVQGYGRSTTKNQVFLVRTYTLTVTNCYEDITITGGRFIVNIRKQILVKPEGVSDVQTWEHAQMTGDDTPADYWTDYETTHQGMKAADWKNLSDLGNVIDRTNDNKNGNWFSDPIRFKRELGYQKPHITVKVVDTSNTGQYIVLQEDDEAVSNALGTDSLGRNALAVELVNLKSANSFDATGTIPQSDVQYYPGKKAPYDYIGNTNDGSNNFINDCGWANIVKDDSFTDGWVIEGNNGPQSLPNNPKHHLYDGYVDSYGNSYSWHENGCGWDDSIDGYYYIRTTKALDQYMRKNINNGQIVIEITADPIRAGIQYEDGTGAANAPTIGTEIENMPYWNDEDYNASGNGYDNGGSGGYNVVDNDTIYIPAGVPSDPDKEYLFKEWQLVDQEGNPVPNPNAGENAYYSFQPGDTIEIKNILSDQLSNAYELRGKDDDERAVFTLKAVWVPENQYTGTKIPVEVNYHMVTLNEENQPVEVEQFYSETLNAVAGTEAWADIFEEDGVTLNSRVENILSSNNYDTENKHYMIYPASDDTSQYYSTTNIPTVSATNAVMDIFLVEVFPVSKITVNKTWTTNNTGTSIPPQATPQTIQVQLQRRITDDSWEDCGNPVTLKVTASGTTIATESHTWTQFKYVDNNPISGTYQYRVIEVRAGDTSINPPEEDGTRSSFQLPSDSSGKTYEFNVSYVWSNGTEETTAEDTDPNLLWTTDITNEYQDPDAEVGALKITKEVINDSENTDSFDFQVALMLPEGKTWNSNGNVETSSDTTITSGESNIYTFQLKDGESITFQDLPENTTCSIQEILDGNSNYRVAYTGGVTEGEDGSYTSRIYRGQTAEVTVENTKMGQLSIQKKVWGPDGEGDNQWIDNTKFPIHVDFEFQPGITPSVERLVNGVYVPVELDQMGTKYRMTLNLNKMDGKLTFAVPVGTTYTAHEHPGDKYDFISSTGTGSSIGDTSGEEGAEGNYSGTIGNTLSSVTFTNKRATGNLAISKEVAGDYASKTAEFTFTLTLDLNAEESTYRMPVAFKISGDGSQSVVKNENVYTFTLKDGETITFQGIPAGIDFQVSEAESSGYTTQYEIGENGGLKDDNATDRITVQKQKGDDPANTVKFINTRIGVPDTAVTRLGTPGVLAAGVLLLGGIGGSTFFYRRRKRGGRRQS